MNRTYFLISLHAGRSFVDATVYAHSLAHAVHHFNLLRNLSMTPEKPSQSVKTVSFHVAVLC